MKNVDVAILISDKIDFKQHLVRRVEDRHVILIKVKLHQQTITTLAMHAPSIGRQKFYNRNAIRHKTREQS